MAEARSKWTSHHLYWHQGPDSRCWDNRPKGAEHYDPRPPQKVIIPAAVPDNVAEKRSPLDRISENGPDAEIYYPGLKQADRLNDYPVLIWPQPWLSPVSMLRWPQLVDIDRTPFVAWDRRVGN